MFNIFKKTITTPPGDILTSTPENSPEIIPGYYFTNVLQSFNINCKCNNITVSPSIITYDFILNNIGDFNETKIKKAIQAIQARYNTPCNIARSTAGDFSIQAVRTTKAALYLKSGIFSRSFNESGRCVACLGVDTLNNVVNLDIAAAPHILIAGTTGSGKSVLLNSLICSLLYKVTPKTGRFLFIDPKQVELSQYEGLPHNYKPIIKGAPAAVDALRELCEEMDARYKYLAAHRVKNINELQERHQKPRIYCIIDELADLMLTSKKAVESYIIRIAQLGRACGIHLIIATQRPTTNIITGLIKANIPCKIALTVSNIADSQTILNHGGAEKLTGRGDAILKTPDKITEIRLQAFFTPSEDIKNIVKYYRKARI